MPTPEIVPAGDQPCATCGHSYVRHKTGRCSMCSQGCEGFTVLMAVTDAAQVPALRATAQKARSLARKIKARHDDGTRWVTDAQTLALLDLLTEAPDGE